MKTTVLLLAAAVLASPTAGLGQTYARHAYSAPARSYSGQAYGGRPQPAGGGYGRNGRVGVFTGANVGGRAYASAYGGQGAYRTGGAYRAGNVDRRYGGRGGYDRYGGGFGVGVLSTIPWSDGGYYAQPAYAYDDSYDQGVSPYVDDSYAAALQQGYDTGAQAYGQAPPAYDDAASGYSNGYVGGASGGQACGQWTWEPVIGRYVWAC